MNHSWHHTSSIRIGRVLLKEALRPYKKCGNEPIFVRCPKWWMRESQEDAPYDIRYQVECEYCGRATREKKTPEGAHYAWQKANNPNAPSRREVIGKALGLTLTIITVVAVSVLIIAEVMRHFGVA